MLPTDPSILILLHDRFEIVLQLLFCLVDFLARFIKAFVYAPLRLRNLSIVARARLSGPFDQLIELVDRFQNIAR